MARPTFEWLESIPAVQAINPARRASRAAHETVRDPAQPSPPHTPETVGDLRSSACPAGRGRNATLVQGVGDLPQARALRSHRGR